MLVAYDGDAPVETWHGDFADPCAVPADLTAIDFVASKSCRVTAIGCDRWRRELSAPVQLRQGVPVRFYLPRVH